MSIVTDYIVVDSDGKFVGQTPPWGSIYKKKEVHDAMGFFTESRAQNFIDTNPALKDCTVKRRTAHYTYESI